MPRSRIRRVFLLFLIPIVASGALVWLAAPWLGEYLIESQEPVRADAIIVLAGGIRGERVLKAAELARQGFAPTVLVSGPMELYGVNEGDLAIEWAVKNGYPRKLFSPVYSQALSTSEEAAAMVPELRRRGLKKVLIVTTDFHTRRAGRIFRAAAGREIEFTMVGARDRFFSARSWWKSRESQKTVFYEWTKTLASAVGL